MLLKAIEEIGEGVWMFRLAETIQAIDDKGTGSSDTWLKIMKQKNWTRYTVNVANRKYISLEGLLHMMNLMNIDKRDVVMSAYRDKTKPKIKKTPLKDLKKRKAAALLSDDVDEFKRLSLLISQREKRGDK